MQHIGIRLQCPRRRIRGVSVNQDCIVAGVMKSSERKMCKLISMVALPGFKSSPWLPTLLE